MITLKEILHPDLEKYKLQKNVRRRHVSVPIAYENVVPTADQDADGNHIRGILLSLARKYMPWLLEEGRFLQLRTPLICIFGTNKKIEEYFFDIPSFEEYSKTHDVSKKRIQYYKGLGSWNADDLQYLIDKEGIDHFLVPFDLDEGANETILNWFLDEHVDFRKEKLLENQFDINKV